MILRIKHKFYIIISYYTRIIKHNNQHGRPRAIIPQLVSQQTSLHQNLHDRSYHISPIDNVEHRIAILLILSLRGGNIKHGIVETGYDSVIPWKNILQLHIPNVHCALCHQQRVDATV